MTETAGLQPQCATTTVLLWRRLYPDTSGSWGTRSPAAQEAEVAVSVRALGKMAETGMPDTVRVM